MLDRLKIVSDSLDRIHEEPRYEIYEGVIYAMAPPSGDHQILVDEINQQLKRYFKGKKCQAFIAPFNVNLTEFAESKKKIVFQPDITVVCEPSKYNQRTGTYIGVPTLIVEVSSPSTRSKDLGEKRFLYELSGVQEYLFIEDRHSASLFTLKDNRYTETSYEDDGSGIITIPIPLFPELAIEIREDWFWFGEEQS
jgi:Uma2 family endonuclease